MAILLNTVHVRLLFHPVSPSISKRRVIFNLLVLEFKAEIHIQRED